MNELEQHRSKYLKAIDQGNNVRLMWTTPEGSFFFNYLKTVAEELKGRVTSNEFIGDHEGYLYTLGVLHGLSIPFEDAEKFIKQYENGKKKLAELEEYEKLNG